MNDSTKCNATIYLALFLMANYWIVWSAKDSNLNNDNILTAGDQDEVTCRTI